MDSTISVEIPSIEKVEELLKQFYQKKSFELKELPSSIQDYKIEVMQLFADKDYNSDFRIYRDKREGKNWTYLAYDSMLNKEYALNADFELAQYLSQEGKTRVIMYAYYDTTEEYEVRIYENGAQMGVIIIKDIDVTQAEGYFKSYAGQSDPNGDISNQILEYLVKIFDTVPGSVDIVEFTKEHKDYYIDGVSFKVGMYVEDINAHLMNEYT